MPRAKETKALGRERLERIIEMCLAIEKRTAEPFTLNIDEIIQIVKQYFPHWQDPEELKLDAETLHHLAKVIKMQSEWVKQRSTALYTDPFLLEEKILQMGTQEMVDVFLHAWSPLVEFEQVSLNSMAQGLLYWEALEPVSERWRDFEPAEVSNSYASRDELIKQRVISDKEFSVELNTYWQELKDCVATEGQEGKVNYWDFIGADTYEQTVQRAFLTSFLITYGFATLEIDALEELVFITPFQKPRIEPLTQQSTSVAIAVSVEDWRKWKEGKFD
jgi:hypothetical protein